mgnify:FL=1
MTALYKKDVNHLKITPHTTWSQQFWEELTPYKDRISDHPFL